MSWFISNPISAAKSDAAQAGWLERIGQRFPPTLPGRPELIRNWGQTHVYNVAIRSS